MVRPRTAARSKDCPMDSDPDKAAARQKLIGRTMVVLLLGLVALYVVVTFWR